MKFKIVTVLFLLQLANAQYNPLKDPKICGRPKCIEDGKFQFQTHVEYVYRYSVDIKNLFSGTSNNESTLHVDSMAHLEFLTKCEGILKFDEVRLLEEAPKLSSDYEYEEQNEPLLPKSSEFAAAVEKYQLRFAFHDGTIAEVCPDNNEPNWVLNYKKGFLSAMQNTMTRFDMDHNTTEIDVSGKCDTVYRLQGARETSLIIDKYRDLSTCKYRYKHHSILQTTPYEFRETFQAWPILRSTSHCELSIDHNIYNSVTCEERHIFQPFSNNDAGATTIARQILGLVAENVKSQTEINEEQDLDPIVRRSNLLYDHVPTPKPTHGELKASRAMLKQLCKLGSDDIHRDYTDSFTNFISSSRALSYTALTQVLSRASSICSTGKKHLLDALPYLGSTGSVQLMRDVLLSNEVSESTAKQWLFTFALIPRPDEETLEAMLPLLKKGKDDPVYALSISSVVHTFCRNNNHCLSYEAVENIVRSIQDMITEQLSLDEEDKMDIKKLLVGLKSVGNIGVITKDFEDTLLDLTGHLLPIEARVAAVEAHRRLDCSKTRDFFVELFRNHDNPSELRIASYLQAMRCPNYLVVRTIRHALSVEEVNQVGSFVWSHLHNLGKSANPSKVEAQGLLTDSDLGQKYNSDARKFSRNYEKSLFFEEYNVGGSVESNIIFSSDSYIPKTTSLNFTADIFGESVNLFEFKTRMEGFEGYVENMFGARGPLSAKKVKEVVNAQLEKMSLNRFRRDVSSTGSENLKKNIDDLPYTVHARHPKAAIGLKVFGNDLKYYTFEGDEEIQEAVQKLNVMAQIKKLLSGKELNYKNAGVFLDTSYTVSTCAGLPLTLQALGSAAIDLRLQGELKAADFFEKKELDLQGSLKPSVTVDVVGKMLVDAYYAETGIKLKSNLYSSSAIDGVVKIRGSRLVSVQFSLPKDKTEIFSARSELIVMRNEEEHVQAGVVHRAQGMSCTWPALDTAFNLKLCAEYAFPNVTKVPGTPSFVLSGPTNFTLAVQKADLTAKKYLLEYKWDKMDNGSHISLIFDTPGSVIKRLFSANLTIDHQSQNLTMLFQAAENIYRATGLYRNNFNETYADFNLDINGNNHLDFQLGCTVKDQKNGFIYEPKLYLAVNNERIAELNGTVKLLEKKSVKQYDVQLTFLTKKLTAKLNGYVTDSEATVSARLNLDYQFSENRPEVLVIDGELSNRSIKSRIDRRASLRIESSAYPQFNFISHGIFRSAAGHLECKLEINTSKDLQDVKHTLTLQFVLVTSDTHEGVKYNVYVIIAKPISNLDVKVQVKYNRAGVDHNGMLLIRYGPDKEILTTVYVRLPRGPLLNIEGKFNMTVPTFSPLIVDGSIHENVKNEYLINLSGNWFSGHSIQAQGMYHDNSTGSLENHYLKLHLKSPSFNEMDLNCKYYHDKEELRLEIQALHGKDNYGFLIKHVEPSPHVVTSYAEVRYKTQLYTVSANLHSIHPRQLLLEIHLDKLRDIHIALRGVNGENRKEFGVEVKWDANRDPSQKVIASVEFSTPYPGAHMSAFVVSYPGRTVTGSIDVSTKEYKYDLKTRLAWSPTDEVALEVQAEFVSVPVTNARLKIQLVTPFEHWTKTALNAGILQHDNLFRANGSVLWDKNQSIAVDVFGDYEVSASTLMCEFNSSLISTVEDVPSLSASFKHTQKVERVETAVYVKYNPQKVISVLSIWNLEQVDLNKTVIGTVTLTTPFEGYNRGLLVSKFTLSEGKDLRGQAELDFDKKKYTMSVKGHIIKLTNNMLEFNLTTPFEKYSKVTGRFGFSEEKRHLVAEVRGPKGAVGLELLLAIVNSADFDVKFNVETPLEILERVVLVGKLKRDEIDFKAGYNAGVVGFSGVWHYENATNFEYSYKVFTPFKGFEENGVVAKLIHTDGLDFELSVKLSTAKLGVKLFGKPQPKPLYAQFGFKRPLLLEPSIIEADNEDDHSGEENLQEVDSFISWAGLLEVDTIAYPTMKGTLDMEIYDSIYSISATLTLPQGVAELRDDIEIQDAMFIRNRLRVSTPLPQLQEVSSNIDFKIRIGESYLLGIDVDGLHHGKWIKNGLFVNYTSTFGEIDVGDNMQIHDAVFRLHTPLSSLPELEVKGLLEIEDTTYRANFTADTNSSRLSVAGNLETDKDYVELSVGLDVTSPLLTIPLVHVNIKKDFTEVDNILEFGLDFLHKDVVEKFQIATVWHIEGPNYLKVKLKVETPLENLPNAECSLLFSSTIDKNGVPFDSAYLQIIYKIYEIKLTGTRKNQHIEVELTTPFEKYRNVTLDGILTVVRQGSASEPTSCAFKGVMRSGRYMHHVSGTVEVHGGIPIKVDLLMVPHEKGGPQGTIKYSLGKTVSGEYDVTLINARIEGGDQYFSVQGKTQIKHKLDWKFDLKIDSSEENIKAIETITQIKTPGPNRVIFSFDSATPWKGFEASRITTDIALNETSGDVNANYALGQEEGSGILSWTWIFMENMQFIAGGSHKKVEQKAKSIYASARYLLPSEITHAAFQNITVGADLSINQFWRVGSNVSIIQPLSDRIYGVDFSLRLPPPDADVHQINARFLSSNELKNVDYSVYYNTEETKKHYGSTGKLNRSIKPNNDTDVDAALKLEWGRNYATQSIQNKLKLKTEGSHVKVDYNLVTPKFVEDTVVAAMTYDRDAVFHSVAGNIHVPASTHLASGEVKYRTLENMSGKLNSTTPLKGLPWLAANFDCVSGRDNKRFLEFFWTNKSALIDSRYTYSSHDNDRDVSGTITVELPLTTKHYGFAEYSYKERPLLTTGKGTVQYNNQTVLDGKYDCTSESRTGFEKDTVDITLENQLKPIGVKYIHVREYDSEEFERSNLKRAEIFQLNNRTGFSVTGELLVKSTDSGQIVELLAIHSDRTVKLSSSYDIQDLKVQQTSRIELAPNVWISYDLQLLNRTKSDNESQEFTMVLSYPRRSVQASGSYTLTYDSLESDVTLLWDKDTTPRTVSAGLNWRKIPGDIDRQEAEFRLTHPSFERDVVFHGNYSRGNKNLASAQVTIQYCNDINHMVTLVGRLQDQSTSHNKKYVFEALAIHPVTNLDLSVLGNIDLKPGLYQTNNSAKYKRSYLPLQQGQLTGIIDVPGQEIDIQKTNMNSMSRLWARADGVYPLYTMNGSLNHGPEVNATGKFYLNLQEKLVILNVNMTEDASQSLHMFGTIPDARSAAFDLWRDYEDIKVADVTYYLRLNHSRLVTSQLTWRPALKSDIKNTIRSTIVSIYDSVSDGMDYWRQYIRSQTADAVNDIWTEAKPYTQGFLDDMGGLQVLEEDYEKFKMFLNESYNDNDFYIRDVYDFTMYVIDELKIRGHIETLPNIVNEIWDVMGESGEALRKSLIWLIETIKTSYAKLLELISDLLHGDSMSQVTVLMERIIEKYDKFIKDIHVSFIKYMEELWTKLYDMVELHWRRALQSIEPSFIKFIHYLETIIWNVGKEILAFLYKRTNEIVESPFFSQVSNFTHDLDKFYKDIRAEDWLTNIRKYSSVIWRFLQEKYARFVPFGKELQDLYNEIVGELKQLQELPSVRYIMTKYDEIYKEAKDFYEYFDIEDRLTHVFNLIRYKITEISQTALEADNRYRDAKTKFVFDPEIGLMKLEQKLPMSWHAFNETPKFEEIPEYKAISEVQAYFVASNTTFWTLHNEYRPYTEPSTWLPPFKAHALIIGQNHFMTFDRRFVEFSGPCTYLMAHDFLEKKFSVALGAPEGRNGIRRLSILAGGRLVQIDITNNGVRLESNSSQATRLPADFGDAVVYQEAEVLTVESELGYSIQCNLQFDVCLINLSGWFFGKTAGLLGTMNNEPWDDLMTSSSAIERNTEVWAKSWSLGHCRTLPPTPSPQVKAVPPPTPLKAITNSTSVDELQEICDSFFKNKVSQFSTCFGVVDSTPFYNICVNGGTMERRSTVASTASEPVLSVNTTMASACSTAMAYMQACAIENTPLRIPENCVKCRLVNGTQIPEGAFVKLKNNEVPKTTDVVFIIEAKPCNADLSVRKSILSLAQALNKALSDANITNNRYAAVLFGGVGAAEAPRSVLINNEIFGGYQSLHLYLDQIATAEGGSKDIFEAISFASRLVFRAGASKTFILLPCSGCDPGDMRLDYSAVHQLLVESGVTLHILMDDEFRFDKTRVNKMFFGMDSQTAYTKKDARELKGDSDLRRQVRVPKTTLGFCTPLALETNGTLFSAKKMEIEKRNPVKKFFTVFAKRVALTATPVACQDCECTAHNTGAAYTLCYPCDFPTPSNIDYGFNEDPSFNNFQEEYGFDDFKDDDSLDFS